MAFPPLGPPLGREPQWAAGERPPFPGIPGSVELRGAERAGYAAVSALTALTAGLGAALVTLNLPQIEGHLGLSPVQGTWLTAAYSMTNISANLLVFKLRQQIGLTTFALIGVSAYAAVALAHLAIDSFAMAVLVQAVAGFASAPMTTLAVLYMRTAFPPAIAWAGVVLGFGLTQFASAIAGMLSPSLLDTGEWTSFFALESGLALCTAAAIATLRLPPGIRQKVLRARDVLTFACFAPALALLVAVLAQGLQEWWADRPWIGYALIAAILLIVAGAVNEHGRKKPLLFFDFLLSREALVFAVGVLLTRVALAEQTYGVVGVLHAVGEGPDQLRSYYAVLLFGQVLGVVASTCGVAFLPRRLAEQLWLALVLIAAASFLDLRSTSVARTQDFVLSQFLLAIGLGLFAGPLLLVNLFRASARGAAYLVSAVVLFGMCQTLGGLLGPAALGSYEAFREHDYSATLAADVDPTQPTVGAALKAASGPFAPVLTDPALVQAEGVSQLQSAATLQAEVRAFNDVFLATAGLALVLLAASVLVYMRRGPEAPPGSGAPTSKATPA